MVKGDRLQNGKIVGSNPTAHSSFMFAAIRLDKRCDLCYNGCIVSKEVSSFKCEKIVLDKRCDLCYNGCIVSKKYRSLTI